MPTIKLTLLDDDDRKQLEGMLVSAMVRAARIIAKEGLVQGWKPPAESAPPIARTVPPPAEAPEAAAPPATSPLERAPAPTMPPHLVAQAPKRQRRDLTKIIKTVEHRPHGWIDRTEALELLGGDQAAESALSKWITDKTIPACIVVNAKPHSKGLPGRVHVDKEALLARNQQRIEFAAANPQLYAWRQQRKQA